LNKFSNKKTKKIKTLINSKEYNTW